MKNSILHKFLAVAAFGFAACSADMEVATPELAVSVGYSEFASGETVRFGLSGDADYVLFYSGEFGNDYRYSSTDRIYPVSLELSFSSRLEGGNQLSDILHVLYSTDFSGEYTAEAIGEATWVDITEKFSIPTSIPADNVTTTPSGRLDITDVPVDGKPFHIAFRYEIDAWDAALANERTNVYVYDFNVNAVYAEGGEPLASQSTVNWQFVLLGDGYADDPYGPNTNASRLCLKCGSKPSSDRVAWAVSAPVRPLSEINIGTDKAVSAKVYYDGFPSSFDHAYASAGEYTAVFEAVNVTADGERSVVRKIPLTVVDAADVGGGEA